MHSHVQTRESMIAPTCIVRTKQMMMTSRFLMHGHNHDMNNHKRNYNLVHAYRPTFSSTSANAFGIVATPMVKCKLWIESAIEEMLKRKCSSKRVAWFDLCEGQRVTRRTLHSYSYQNALLALQVSKVIHGTPPKHLITFTRQWKPSTSCLKRLPQTGKFVCSYWLQCIFCFRRFLTFFIFLLR